MTRTEMGKMMALLQATYPAYYKDVSDDDAASIVTLWNEMFADDPAELVTAAVKRLILSDNKGFPPTIGQIKDNMHKITHPDEMNAQEAWTLVKKAVRAYCLYDKPETNPYYKLPKAVQRAIGGPGQIRDWSMMDESAFDSVEGSHFKRAYQTVTEQEKERQKLPESTKTLIAELGRKMSLAQTEDHATGEIVEEGKEADE